MQFLPEYWYLQNDWKTYIEGKTTANRKQILQVEDGKRDVERPSLIGL